MLTRLKRALKRRLLSAGARAAYDDNLTMLGLGKMRRLEGTLRRLDADRIPGDFIECGLALGGSGIVIAQHARAGGRAFHGFDVFGMIPPPTSDKDDEKSKRRYEEIAAGRSKGIGGKTYYGYIPDLFGVVSASFARHGVPVDGTQVGLHKGLFEDTMPATLTGPIAFAHVDCDWYDPVRFCLDFLAERIVPGGAILVDDFHNYGGSRTATEEFLREQQDFRFEDGENVVLWKRPAA